MPDRTDDLQPQSRSILGLPLAVALSAACALAACGGDTTTPGQPSALPDATGSTTIAGTARVAGTSGSPSATGAGALRGATSSGGGLRVCVVETGDCLDVDQSGTFELVGDFSDTVTLHFLGRGQDARVTVHNVQPGETILVTVDLAGTRGSLQVDQRRGGRADSTRRIELCHVTGDGRYRWLEVDASAEAAHLDHGDGVPGGDVPDEPGAVFGPRCDLVRAAVRIEKSTNGQDADAGPGPSIPVGTPVTWSYVITNPGPVPLTNLVVSDSDPALDVVCDAVATLAPGGELRCSAEALAEPGRYRNLGSVRADSDGGPVSDTDPSHYVGERDTPPPPDRPDPPTSRVTLCHRTGNGYRLLEVAASAEAAHLRHGDGYPGDAVPDQRGAVFDRACGVIVR